MTHNNLQTVQNLASRREKLCECGVPLVMPESEWDQHGMQSLGPQRWRNRVQDVDLHKCNSLLESNVQAPLTAACEEAAADDEHSDTDDEDQHVEYREYDSSVHSIV
jgi:hypothetical protein